jgi:hypothetical protein
MVTVWRRVRAQALLAGLAAAALVALHMHDPHVSGAYGYCPFHAATGWWCPGCGGLRALNDLTDGRFLAALHSNVLVAPLAVGAVAWWGRSVAARWRGEQRPSPAVSGSATVSVLVLVVVFTVLRNTPWGRWLTPV